MLVFYPHPLLLYDISAELNLHSGTYQLCDFELANLTFNLHFPHV